MARLKQSDIDKATGIPGKKTLLHDAEVRGLKLRISEKGAKSYVCMYTAADGARRLMTLGAADRLTLPQARAKAKALLGRVADGEDPAADKEKAKAEARLNPSLQEFIDIEFAPHIMPTKSGKATLGMLRRNFDFLMHTKLAAIDKAELMRWQTRCVHKGRKPATINRNLAALRSCLSYAVGLGVLKAHPLAGLKDRKNDATPKVRYLDADEERRLYAALDAREVRRRQERDSANAWRRQRGYPEFPSMPPGAFTDHVFPMIIVSLHTGIRRGELFALRWADIDLRNGILTVRAESAKSGKERYIPLNRDAHHALARWQAHTGVESGLVFPSADGGKRDNTKKAWRKIVQDAALENFTWHSMRHDFASKLAMRGVDLNSIRELLGHSDYATTLIYAHLCPKHKAAAVQVLERATSSNVLSFPARSDQP